LDIESFVSNRANDAFGFATKKLDANGKVDASLVDLNVSLKANVDANVPTLFASRFPRNVEFVKNEDVAEPK
jgi:hypothetical protein